MKYDVSWKERYLISLKEEFTILDIMKLRSCGNPRATKIRKQAICYCLENEIPLEVQKVPAIAVFEVTGCDVDYYYKKACQEAKSFDLAICEG